MRDSRVDLASERVRARRVAGLWLAALSGAVFCSAGCDEKKTSTEAPATEAGVATDKYATADPKLAKALQGAASASPTGDKGPPPGGIFAPGVADARHARGAPTTVDLISDGAEPRVTLAPAGDGPPTSLYGLAVLQLVTQAGPRVVLPVDFALMLGPGKKDEGGSDWLVAEVKKAALGKEQLSELPPGTDKEVAALSGVSIQMKVTPDGRESRELRADLGKAAASDLARIANDAAEALLFATVPLPAKPVGVGAQWIAETRMPLTGLDTVVYRAYRVKDAGPDRVRLSLDAKAYAAGKEVQLQGVPAGATLEQFEAQIGGDIELARGEGLARKSQVQERVVLVLAPAGGVQAPPTPGQPGAGMMTAQLQNQSLFVRGDDLRVTAKQP